MDGIIGSTTLFAGNFAPLHWDLCQGQLLPISQNAALFSILGTSFGGDGRVTFALPNLVGNAVVSTGQGPGLSSYALGETAGSANCFMLMSQMPIHSHNANVNITPAEIGRA